MKERNVLTLQNLSHKVLFLLSWGFSINLFLSFSNELIPKIIFGTMASAYEIIKYFILLKGKWHWKKNKKWLGGFEVFIAILLTCVSIIASTGFALSTIEKQSIVADNKNAMIEIYESEIKALDNDIKSLDKEILGIQNTRDTTTEKAFWYKDKFTKAIKEIQEKKDNKLKEKSEKMLLLQEEKNKSFDIIQSSNDIFDNLGKPVGIEGFRIRFWLILVMVTLLEFMLILTADSIIEEPKEKKERKRIIFDMSKLLNNKPKEEGKGEVKQGVRKEENSKVKKLKNTLDNFVISLYNNKSKECLNNKEELKKITGFDYKLIEAYKNKLKKSSYHSKPLLQEKEGKLFSEFNKNELMKIIKILKIN